MRQLQSAAFDFGCKISSPVHLRDRSGARIKWAALLAPPRLMRQGD